MASRRADYFAWGEPIPEEPYAWKRENVETPVSTFSRFHAEGMPCVPPFPVDTIPQPARRLVERGAASLAAPADYIALPLLVYTGAVIGNRCSIQLKRGWEQYPTLYGAVIAPPGAAKSPADDIARAPLDRLQAEAYERFKMAMDRYDADLSSWESGRRDDRGPRPEKPLLDHYIVIDATLEAIGPILARSDGVAMARDELAGWVRSHDQYRNGKGADRQAYLSMWSGAPLKIDRKSGDTVYVQHPVLCVVGGIQPDMLHELSADAGRRDGFTERLIVAYPDPCILQWTDDTVEPRVIDDVADGYRMIRTSPPGAIPLSDNARREFIRWHDANATFTQQASGFTQGMAAKLPNTTARLALILHCLSLPSDPLALPVSLDTMQAAIELSDYFRAHAQRMYAHVAGASKPRVESLESRVERLLTEAGEGGLLVSDLARQLGGHVPADDLRAALWQLADIGTAECEARTPGERGGRPGEVWRVKT